MRGRDGWDIRFHTTNNALDSWDCDVECVVAVRTTAASCPVGYVPGPVRGDVHLARHDWGSEGSGSRGRGGDEEGCEGYHFDSRVCYFGIIFGGRDVVSV
jgi:hypothetical protein